MRSILKYIPLNVAIYNALLRYRCRSVQAYVFVATTGRSGSESLSKIFEVVDGAVCYHEPYPIMFNDSPAGSEPKRYLEDRFKKIKRINIRRSAAGHRYYVETNHQFIKNFCSLALDHFGKKIRIIHLVRHPVQVATSFHAIGSIPGETRNGQIYLLDPKAEDNRIKLSDLLYSIAGFSHDYFKCLWYWYEVETRIKQLKASHPDVLWSSIETHNLNDRNALMHLFQEIGIDVDSGKLESVVGTRRNTKAVMKAKEIPVEECKLMHKQLLARMEERYGVDFWC